MLGTAGPNLYFQEYNAHNCSDYRAHCGVCGGAGECASDIGRTHMAPDRRCTPYGPDSRGLWGGVALEQSTRLELGSLCPRLAPGVSAASSALLAPVFRTNGSPA